MKTDSELFNSSDIYKRLTKLVWKLCLLNAATFIIGINEQRCRWSQTIYLCVKDAPARLEERCAQNRHSNLGRKSVYGYCHNYIMELAP